MKKNAIEACSERYSARLSIIATAMDSWWRMALPPPPALLLGLRRPTGGDSAGRAAATTGFFFFAIGFFGGVTACRVTSTGLGASCAPGGSDSIRETP